MKKNVIGTGFNSEFFREEVRYSGPLGETTRIAGNLHRWSDGVFMRNATAQEQIAQDRNPGGTLTVQGVKCFVQNHQDLYE